MNDRWSIFISYRRDDTEGYARFLHRLLLEWFDADEVYFDHQSTSLGSDFLAGIGEAIDKRAKVVLVLVGKRWLGELIERARTGVDDPVRLELSLALRKQRAGCVTVIPVLAGGTAMPAMDMRRRRSLPEDVVRLVEELCALHALTLFSESVAVTDSQFERLLSALARASGIPAPTLKARQTGLEPAFDLGGHQPALRFADAADVLDRMTSRLCPGGAADRVARCTLSGMAGTGKTEAALQFCLVHRAACTGGIWWFPGHDEAAFTAAVERACRTCLVPLAPGCDVCTAWRQYLEQTRRPWLLVVDDAPRADVAHRISPRFGPHRVLVTTRSLGAEDAIELTPWPHGFAVDYLRERLPADAAAPTGADCSGLAEALGCLPLALSHAVGYLRATRLGLAQYLRQLNDVDAAPAWLGSSAAGPVKHPVLATIGSALRHCSPSARCLLETLACCAAEPVPEAWLRSLAQDTSAPAPSALDEEIRWNDLLAELVALALVQRTGTYEADLLLSPEQPTAARSRPCLQLNRLTQQAVLATLPAASPQRQTATRLLRAAAEAEIARPGRSAEYACLVPHLLFRASLDGDADAAGLLRTTFQLHVRKGDLAAALDCSEQWLARCTALFGHEAPATLQTRVASAETQRELGLVEPALAHAGRVVALCTGAEGQASGLRARAACVVARITADAGDVDAALQIYADELIDRYVLGPETPGLSDWLIGSLAHMGATLSAAGRAAQALDTHRQLLEMSDSVFGPGHEATLSAASALAGSMRDLGDTVPAADMFRQVVAGCLDLSGMHHPRTVDALCALAETLHALAHFGAAIDVFQQARSAANLTFADDDPRHGRIERGLELAVQAQRCAD